MKKNRKRIQGKQIIGVLMGVFLLCSFFMYQTTEKLETKQDFAGMRVLLAKAVEAKGKSK